MRLYSDIEHQFPDDFRLIVKALAHQGGLAIQNNSMFLQLEKTRNSWKKMSGDFAPGYNDFLRKNWFSYLTLASRQSSPFSGRKFMGL